MSSIQAVTYERAWAVTQSDTALDPHGPFAAFWSGSGGTIRVFTIGGQDVTLVSVQAGEIITLAIQRVFVSTTTATGIVGFGALPWKGN